MEEGSFATVVVKSQGLANRRMFVIILVLIALLFSTNIYWIYQSSQYNKVVTTTNEVTQDAEAGDNTFVGGDMVG